MISAPTGAGKTVVMELCMLRLYSGHLQRDGTFQSPQGRLKTLYLAPSLALVQVREQTSHFKPSAAFLF